MRKASLLLIATACAGKAPPNPGGGADAAQTADAPTAASTAQLSGSAIDFFGGQAVAGLTITTDGIDPSQMTTSGSDGAYTFAMPIGSKLYLISSKSMYRNTRSAALSVADLPVTQDIYAMAGQDVKNQYTGVGKTPTQGTAFLVIELLRRNGQPLVGIPITGIQLLDSNNQPVLAGSAYFFNAQGALDGSAGSAVLGPGGHSRAAILDVLPGRYTLAVTYAAGQGGNQQDNTTVETEADGATIAPSNYGSGGGSGSGSGMGSGSGSGSGTPPTFATDIYPRLQRAGAGGLGCANCHTALGTAAVLPYDAPPATVLANMKAITGVVDTVTPASSLFLTKPLYELTPPQNHPNATFLDTNDPDYIKFLAWITAGAN